MEDRCIVCGEVIPEGRMVCPNCEEKKCGFEDVSCFRKCIYFMTCTRNPYRYEQKGEQHDKRRCE